MADDKQFDPTASFQELVTQWERNFNAYANEIMGTEAFSQAMNEAQKAQLSQQRAFSEAMTRHLTSMNVPTRDDVLRLTELVKGLDRRLEHIESRLETATTQEKPRKKPKRTKKPPVESKAGD